MLLPKLSVVTRWNSELIETIRTNITMGDTNLALEKMLVPKGVDKRLLYDSKGKATDIDNYRYTENDRMVLRQYECAAEPCYNLSMFFQNGGPTSHEVIFHLRTRIAEMRSPVFTMWADMSDSIDVPNLKKRLRLHQVRVKWSIADEDKRSVVMDDCIEKFRGLYARDMELRCGLVEKDTGEPAKKLPVDTAVAALLNPLYGGKVRITKSGLMTEDQYDQAQEDLLSRVQKMRESDFGVPMVVDAESSSSGNDSMDDPVVRTTTGEREKSVAEFTLLNTIVKRRKNFPRTYKGTPMVLKDITIGVVSERGDDIKATHPFVHCNLADFVDNTGHFDLVGFYGKQKKTFPYLFKLATCLASVRTNEVGCERFFSTAGYVSSVKRTRLHVRNYECLSMLYRNMTKVYIDEEWVVKRYLKMEKAKSWDALEDRHDLLVLDLEKEIYGENQGVAPSEEAI